MNSHTEQSSSAPDAKLLSAEDLLPALHAKFCRNFTDSRNALSQAIKAERGARALSVASTHLEHLPGNAPHQVALAKCLDEIFGDSMCAIYLAYCGMNVPARMLLRRSLELGLVVAAYWDSPVKYWAWREHDGDIRFTELCEYLQSDGYKTLCKRQAVVSTIDASDIWKQVNPLYNALSNVVHPKPYNFSTAGVNAYSFQLDDLSETLQYAVRVHSALAVILSERFADVTSVLIQ